jgi:hypothetical protein
MAIQYINISENDFGKGIDARSAENQIGEGFVKDLLNADIIQKSVQKRTGYESYAGNIPVRAFRMEYINIAGQREIRFVLDKSISLDGEVYPSPIIVYGKSSKFSSGPFNTSGNSVKYYETYTVPYRKVLRSDLASQAAGYTIPGTEHGLNTSALFCNIAECDSDTGNSYSQIIPNSLTIDTNTYDINIGYSIPSTGQNVDIFTYYLKANAGTGTSFIYDWNHLGAGNETKTILPAQHNLVTNNILYRAYQVVGNTWQEVKLNSFLLSPSGNGIAVQVSIDSNDPAEYKLVLYATSITNIAEGIIAADLSEKKIVLSNVSSPWMFYNLYIKNIMNQYEHIEPDLVEYSETTKELTFYLSTPLQVTYRLIYQQGTITSNILAVKDTTIVGNDIDNFPQITIWGLDHSKIYTEHLAREGWTTYLDTYKRSGERKVVAGLGGNLFIARNGTEFFDTVSEQQYSQEYNYPAVRPFLQSLSSGIKQKIGRLFYDTGDTPGRSRGYITSDMGGTGWVSVTSVEYDSNTGWTKYTLSVPNMKIYNSSNIEITNINSTISVTSGLEDWLTVNNMSYKKHEGTFKIRQRIKGTESLQIWVENSNNISDDWDDLHAGGFAGVFTDKIVWTAQVTDDFNIFIPGDKLFIFQEEFSEVYSSSHSSQTTVCGPLDYVTEIVENLVVTGQRKSSVIPIRSGDSILTNLYNRDVSNLVQGDMLSYTGIDRLIKVQSVNINRNLEVDITSDGNTATVKLTPEYISLGFTIKALSPGHKILLVDAGNYTGVHTVDTVISGEEFTVKTTFTDSVSNATFIGKTIEIDEELLWTDSPYDVNEFTVKRRWIPIEAPEDIDDLTPSTYIRHLDSELYWNQPFLRSAMVSDNLYMTNGSDEVMKFDGQNVYRAGLPAWQPGLFTTLSANPATRTCSLSNGNTTVTVTGGGTTEGIELGVIVSGTHVPSGATIVSITSSTQFVISLPAAGGGNSSLSFTVPKKVVINLRKLKHKGVPNYDSEFRTNILELNQVYEDGAIPAGSKVRINGLPTIYTIQSYIEKNGTAYIQFLENLEPAIDNETGIIEETGVYKYYFRLNAVDANDNIIASAMTSSDDMSVTMSQDAAVRLKLVGMPALDNYNYSRIEIEIYRTKLLTGAVAPVFYKVVTLGSTSTPSVNFNNTTGYLEYIDTAADADLTELDLTSSIAGAELGIGWSEPLRAKYVTTADNRLILGNVRDYPEFDIQIDGQTNLTASIFAGDTLLFRKDSEDTAPDTNMVDRVKFEWKDDFSGNVSTFGVGSNEFSFTTSVDLEAAGTVPGDWIYLTYDKVLTSARDTTYSGWWQIKQVSGTSIVVQLIGASAAVSYPNKYVVATNSKDVPVYLGTDGNLGQTSGDDQGSTTEVFDATRRLALALNSVMRQVDTGLSVPDMTTFRPWLIARSGNDVTRAGRIIVRAPYGSELIPSVVPTFSGYSLYVNSLPVETADNVEAAERVYPSRILVSYPNYPEIFDSPTATLDLDSLSAIDINPADGQEITGIIPFFGEAAFTAAQQAGILVVFKTNSIYLVDINQKVSGSNLVVQRLETQGLGCTAPYSIASTKNGIMFANNSGIYCLRRNQAIEYIGKFMERNWSNKVEKEALSIAQGHHYNIGRMYKLSVPIIDTQNKTTGYIEPSEVYVYNHSQEDEEQRVGAWSRYDNHNAIGWANLASDAFWASTNGQVYILRTTGTETDYRDSSQPIVFRLDTRPNSYGNSGIRKIVNKILANYRAGTDTANNNLYFSVDLEQEYSETTPFRIAGTRENLTGIDDLVQKDVVTLTHNIGRRKGVYFSIRIENSSLDQNVEIAGLDYQIGGLNSEGIKTASET